MEDGPQFPRAMITCLIVLVLLTVLVATDSALDETIRRPIAPEPSEPGPIRCPGNESRR